MALLSDRAMDALRREGMQRARLGPLPFRSSAFYAEADRSGAALLLDLLVTLVTGQASANLRRFSRAAIFAALTVQMVLIALTAGAAALFLELDAEFGAIRASLIVAAAATALAGLASIPLWWKAKPPPPTAAETIAHLALAVGLGLLAERKRKKEEP